MVDSVKISYFERSGVNRREFVLVPECSLDIKADYSIKSVWRRRGKTDQYYRCRSNKDKVLILRVINPTLKMVEVIGCDGCPFNTQ